MVGWGPSCIEILENGTGPSETHKVDYIVLSLLIVDLFSPENVCRLYGL